MFLFHRPTVSFFARTALAALAVAGAGAALAQTPATPATWQGVPIDLWANTTAPSWPHNWPGGADFTQLLNQGIWVDTEPVLISTEFPHGYKTYDNGFPPDGTVFRLQSGSLCAAQAFGGNVEDYIPTICIPIPATGFDPAQTLAAPIAAQGLKAQLDQLSRTAIHLSTLGKLPAGKPTMYVLSSETSRRETSPATASNPTLNVDRADAVLGTDYRYNDAWVGGASLGVANPRMRWSDATEVKGQSVAASAYVSWSPTSQSYVATALSYERTRYTLLTNLDLIGGSTPNTNGVNLGLSISAGYDLSLGRISVSPYVRVDQVSSRVGNFGADAPINQGASTAINAGAQVQTNVPTSWGVLVPHARLELTHITRWALQGNSADAYAAGTNAVFTANPLEVDRRFGQAGVGLSMLLQRGFSVFTDYDTGFAQQNLKTWRFTLGLRAEL